MARFFRRGVTKIYWLPTIAATVTVNGVTLPGVPTAPEFTSGTDLSPQITDVNGMQLSNNPIDAPDLSTAFTAQIDGPDSTADTSFVFHDDNAASNPIRTALAKGTAGYIVYCPYGKATGKRAEAWPAKTTGVNDQVSLDATTAKYTVSIAITGTPNQSVVLT